MSTKQAAIVSFVQSAPPGELSNVIFDLKVLADASLLQSLDAAYKKYNEEEYIVVKLPGASESKASNTQQHPLESKHADLIRSLQTSFSKATTEHFPSASIGIYPTDSDSAIAIILVANKYSPQNFWNGRWRSTYILDPSSNTAMATIKVDVHYYEDGNVRMTTSKKAEISSTSGGAEAIVREIVKLENAFQEQLNRAFGTLAEGSFKALRRQLPVTRQRVEWEKIGGYRLGQDVAGGRQR